MEELVEEEVVEQQHPVCPICLDFFSIGDKVEALSSPRHRLKPSEAMNFTPDVVALLQQPRAACVPLGLSPEVARRVGCAVQVGVKDDEQVPEHLSSVPRQRPLCVLRPAGGERAGEEDEQKRQASWKESETVSLVEEVDEGSGRYLAILSLINNCKSDF